MNISLKCISDNIFMRQHTASFTEDLFPFPSVHILNPESSEHLRPASLSMTKLDNLYESPKIRKCSSYQVFKLSPPKPLLYLFIMLHQERQLGFILKDQSRFSQLHHCGHLRPVMLCFGGFSCIRGCLALSLSSTHQRPVAVPFLPPYVTPVGVSRHCKCSWGNKFAPVESHQVRVYSIKH